MTVHQIEIPAAALFAAVLLFVGPSPGRSATAAAVRTEPDVVATLAVEGKSRALSPQYLGYNGNLARGGSWADPELVAAFRALSPGHLRYPAGTLANYWDWQSGWFKPGVKLPYGLSGAKPNPYRLEDLKLGCDASGAEPLIVLNLLTSTLEEQLALLRAARKIGLDVRRVELGNEFYLSGEDHIAKFPAPEDYGRVANEWTAAIKREFPGIKIGLVGAAVRSTDDLRRKTWNERLLRVAKGADALVLHVYQGAGLAAKADATMEAAGLVREPARQAGSWGTAREQKAQRGAFDAPDGVARMIGAAFSRWNELPEVNAIPAGMEGWVTEYNLFDRNGPVRGTWAHGLFAAVLTLNWLQDERLTVATFHSLYGNAMFDAIHSSSNSFKGLAVGAEPTTPYALTAAGRALALLGQGLRGVISAQKIVFPQNPMIAGNQKRTYPSLVGWEFTAAEGRSLFLMNVSSESFTLPPGGILPRHGDIKQVYGDPRKYVSGPASLTERTAPLSLSGVTLPPYSCTWVRGSVAP